MSRGWWKHWSTTTWVVFGFWVLALFWGEWLTFRATMTCDWPHVPGRLGRDRPMHVAIIADPQLTDRYSYSSLSNSTLLHFVQFYSDLYMKRLFYLLQTYKHPSHIFILGDLFDSTKQLDDTEYEAELARFKSVFRVVNPKTSLHYIPGNHDIGYKIPTVSRLAGKYMANFGPLNQQVTVDGFEFVLISAPTLEPSAAYADEHDSTLEFIESVKNENATLPRILLTHIPLYRERTDSCGPLRTSTPQIPNHFGYSYTCLLPQTWSSYLLNSVKPMYIFSGDDHDQCTVVHWNNDPDNAMQTLAAKEEVISQSNILKDGVIEQTVGTFSWLQGNPYPSFALVSLYPGNKGKSSSADHLEPVVAVNICFGPQQLYIYYSYIVLACLSLLLLIGDHIWRTRPQLLLPIGLGPVKRTTRTTLKTSFQKYGSVMALILVVYVSLLVWDL
jgi:hypothetical protein